MGEDRRQVRSVPALVGSPAQREERGRLARYARYPPLFALFFLGCACRTTERYYALLLPILLLLWGLVLVPPLVRRPLVARSAAASDPMVAFRSRLSRIERTNVTSKPLMAAAILTPSEGPATASGSPRETEELPADQLLVGFNLVPANRAEAELRRRCVAATLLALTILSALAIPSIGILAIVVSVGSLGVTGLFGYAWWHRNQPPSPFAGLATGVPLPSSMTARSFGEVEPVRR